MGDAPTPMRLRITTRSGSVRVAAYAGSELVVRTGHVAMGDQGWMTVSTRPGSGSIDVACPPGTDLIVGTSSGHVEIMGQLGFVSVVSASGSVHVDQVLSADIRVRSGQTRVGHCLGPLRVVSGNGQIDVGQAGRVELSTESGSITVDVARGGSVRAVSGSVRVGVIGDEPLTVRSISGSIDVTVPRGAQPNAVLHTKSGSVRNDCPHGTDATIDARTLSGWIHVGQR